MALPLVLISYSKGRGFHDQEVYHLPAVRHFMDGGGVGDYSSATTPGYHQMIAFVGQWSGGNLYVMQGVNALITLGLLIGLTWLISGRSVSTAASIVLILPVIFSLYMFPAGVWLLPDNLAWFLCGACLWLLWREPVRKRGYREVLLIGTIIALSVWVRQTMIWLLVPMWVRGAVLCNSSEQRLRNQKILWAYSLASLPALALIGFVIIQWNGVVPPSFAERHVTINPAGPAFMLALIGVYGFCYLSCVWEEIRQFVQDREFRKYLFWGAGIGCLLACCVNTSYSWEYGRASGLWNAVRLFPVVSDRSLLICGLSGVGGAVITVWVHLARGMHRWGLLASLPAFALTQVPNHFVFQKYYAGFLFIVFLLSLHFYFRKGGRLSRGWWVGPAGLACTNAMILVRALI